MKLPVLVSGFAQENVSSIPSQDAFFGAISKLCGVDAPPAPWGYDDTQRLITE